MDAVSLANEKVVSLDKIINNMSQIISKAIQESTGTVGSLKRKLPGTTSKELKNILNATVRDAISSDPSRSVDILAERLFDARTKYLASTISKKEAELGGVMTAADRSAKASAIAGYKKELQKVLSSNRTISDLLPPKFGGELENIAKHSERIMDADSRLLALDRGISWTGREANAKELVKEPSMIANAIQSGAYGAASGYSADDDGEGIGAGMALGLIAPFAGKLLGNIGRPLTKNLGKLLMKNETIRAANRAYRNFAVGVMDNIASLGPKYKTITDLILQHEIATAQDIGKIMNRHGAMGFERIIANPTYQHEWVRGLENYSKILLTPEQRAVTLKNLSDAYGLADAQMIINNVDEARNFAFANAADRARKTGLSVLDRKGNENGWKAVIDYFPQVADPQKIQTQAALDSIVEATKKTMAQKLNRALEPADILKAERSVNRYVKNYRTGISSYLEHERNVTIPKELQVEPTLAYQAYLEDAYGRLNRIEYLGHDSDVLVNAVGRGGRTIASVAEETRVPTKIEEILKDIKYRSQNDPIEAENLQEARKLLSRLLNLDNKNHNYGDMFTRLRQLQTLKLSLAFIPNATQGGNSIIGEGLYNTAKGYASALNGTEGKMFAELSGALKSQMLNEMGPPTGLVGKLNEKMFKYTGFNFEERLNRTMSAITMRNEVESYKKMLDSGKLLDTIQRRKLDSLGIRIDALRSATGKDLEQIYLKAGYMGAKNRQFMTGVGDLPYHWQSPFARVAFQFKSFALKQSHMIYRDVMQEAMNGNTVPLTRLIFYGTLLGGMTSDLKAFLKGDKSQLENTDFQNKVKDLASFGGFGLLDSLYTQSIRSPQGMAGFMAGPTGSDIGEFTYGGLQAVTPTENYKHGNPKPILRSLMKRVPFGVGTKQLNDHPKFYESSPDSQGMGGLGSLGGMTN